MKKSIVVLLCIGAVVLASCQSTKQENQSLDEATEKNEIRGSTKKESQAQTPLSSKAQFKELLQEVELTVDSTPRETVKGKAFSSAYKIKATNADGQPASQLSVTVEYPESRNEQSVSYQKAAIVTDANGEAQFEPPVPTFAISDKVLFYPMPPASDPELVRLASEAAAEAPWKVKSNLTSRSGILVSIVDYKQNGSILIGNGTQPSAQALTANLWRANLMGAQNADFHNSIDADDPARIRSDALKQLGGNSLFKFVVYGRVKYASGVAKDADGYYTVTFNGDLGALNIASGEVLLKTAKTVTVKDKSEWKVIDTARQEMAKLFCEELIYSLYN